MEYIQFASKGLVHKQTDEGFFVRGFASIEGVDRDGDNIPSRAFDISTFMKNPQLWFNHRLYPSKTDEGADIDVPIGIVESMNLVVVEDLGNEFQVKDLNNDQIIASFEEDEKFLVKRGDKGLWVTVRVIEKDIVNLVKDGRINAFSWSGTLIRNATGTIKSVDIREVSLVFLPANARALLMVGKSSLHVNDLYGLRDGNFLLLKENPATVDAKDGAAFVTLAKSASGHITTLELAVDSLEAASELASEMAKEVDVVGVFKNTWRASTDGAQVYKLCVVVEGLCSEMEPVENAVLQIDGRKIWSRPYIDDLPDECFAYIIPKSKKDADGKTLPRTSRMYAFKSVDGTVNADMVKQGIDDALGSAFKRTALPVLVQAAKKVGVGDFLDSDKFAGLTKAEQSLLGIDGEIAISESDKEGGENVDEVLKALENLSTEFKALSDKVDGFEELAKANASSEEDEDVSSDKDDQEPIVTPEGSKHHNPELETQILDGMKAMTDGVAKLADRVAHLEGRPVASKASTDTTAGATDVDDDSKDVDVGEDLIADIRKAFSGMSEDQRKKAKTDAVAEGIFGDTAREHAKRVSAL